MRRIIFALLLLALVLAALPVRGASPLAIFLPLATRERAALLSLNVVPGAVEAHIANLTLIDADWFRSNFGNQIYPYQAPYQQYLSGGWPAVDAQLVAELALWAEIGAEPLIVFMRGGLPCKVPTLPQLALYGDFIVAAAERYDLERFEVWNEPDLTGGYPSLFGCWGTAHASKLNYLLDYVQARTERLVGVSYQAGSQTQMNFLLATAGHADWVGVHYYANYSAGVVTEGWPGSIMGKVDMASAAGVPVWLTEVNLKASNVADFGPAHQAAQAEWVMDALNLPVPMVSILVYYKYPDWQATGIRTTQLENELMGTGYPAPGQ